MALDAKIIGATSGVGADTDSSKNLQVVLPLTLPNGDLQGGGQASAGFAAMLSEADSGSVTGARETREAEVTSDFRLRTGVDVTMFNEVFPGTVLNSSIWTAPVTTSVTTVSGNFLVLNSSSSLASGAVARVQTYRSFPCYVTYPLYATIQLAFSATPVVNCIHEWGVGIATGVAAPTDGAFFRINATAQLQAIVSVGGSETPVTITDFDTLIGINTTRQFLVTVGADHVDFWIDNIKVASVDAPAASALTTGSAMLPVLLRSYNTGTVTGTACLMKVGAVNVTLGEMNANKAWSHVMAGAGGMCYQGQTGQTLTSTALYTNSLAAGAGVAATNTTAALGSGLGGQFSLLPTLAASTDGVISSYQVPVGTASAPGKALYITGYTLEGLVTTVLVGGPVLGAFSIAYGHNNVSLATATSSTARAPIRVPVGYQVYAAAAPVGAVGARLQDDFDRGPIVVQPGEFIQIVMKNLGTVTTTGVITFLIKFDGYWE